MGPNERIFKKDYAWELLNLAKQDLKTAEVLAKSSEVRKENTLFHIEQAVEKSLKAVLCYCRIAIPFTHDLHMVLERLPKDNLPPGGMALNDFTPFATIRRYEEGNFEITGKDLKNSIRIARDTIQWAEKTLGAK